MILRSPLAALSNRLAPVIAGLCRAVAAQAAAHPPLASLLLMVWSRLGRMAGRFASLAARAGESQSAGPRLSEPRSLDLRSSGSRSSVSCERLPGGFAWLVRLVPEAACYGAQLQHLLSDPDVAAALAAAPPGAGRVLRPLCRMLGVVPGPALTVAPDEPLAPGDAPGRKRRSDPPVPDAVRARRSRVPRSFGRPWLRWRPAGAAS